MSAASILDAFASTFSGRFDASRIEEEHPVAEGDEGAAETARLAAEAAEAPEQQQQQQQQLGADQYVQKIERITAKFTTLRGSADELEGYLKHMEAEAKEAEARALLQADAEFTPAWRNTGLPMKPSHLQLDPAKIAGARLVNPKTIMGQYQDLKSKEVLKPPHIYAYNDTSIQSNYLKTTKNLENRTGMIKPETLSRAHDLSLKSRTWHLMSDTEVSQRVAESEERRRVQDLRMPPAQYELEKKIIESMHHKLSFLRNPRFPLPPAVKALQAQFQPGPKWNVPEKAADARRAPPIKFNMTSRAEQIFVVQPEVVVFTGYEVGKVYTQKVSIRNVTAVIRSLRVLPPASQYFHMSLPRFPTDAGSVAPGMAAEVTLRFCPDSLADYDDEFAIDSAEQRFTVQVQARRPPPSLTLPQELHLGVVLVGNHKSTQFSFTNLGGAGRFRIIPEGLWPDAFHDAPEDVAHVGPFDVWPLYLDMATGDTVGLNVGFEPTEVGSESQRFVMVCDNCCVRDFTVVGVGGEVDVQLCAINGRAPEPDRLNAPISFGEVVPGSGSSKHLTVRNVTSLPVPFQWHHTAYPQTRTVHPMAETHLDGSLRIDDDTAVFAKGSGGTASGVIARGGHDVRDGPLPGSGAFGRVDLVDLEMDLTRPFVVEPAEGVLPPGEQVEFKVSFLPLEPHETYERWVQLRVDRTQEGYAPQGYNFALLELGLEGLGVPLHLDISPRSLVMPGTLTPGASASGTLSLINPTRAPARFRLEPTAVSLLDKARMLTGEKHAIVVSHPEGEVAPMSALDVTVTFTASAELFGPQQHALLCTVEHGPPFHVVLLVDVVAPTVSLAEAFLDFGLVRRSDTRTLEVTIRNGSATAPAAWSIGELLEDPDDALAVGGGEGGGEGTAAAAVEEGRAADVAGAAAAGSREGSEAGEAAPEQEGGGTAAEAAPEPAPEPELTPGPAQEGGAAAKAAPELGGEGSGAGEAPAQEGSETGAVPSPVAEGSGGEGDPFGLSLEDSEPPLSAQEMLLQRMHVSLEELVARDPSAARTTTHIVFDPPCGTIAPGATAVVRATLVARGDGPHASAVVLRGPDGSVCVIEADAVVVTPMLEVSTPRLDLGTSYLGVVVRKKVDVKNTSLLPLEFKFRVDSPGADGLAELKITPEAGRLEPGETQELRVRYKPYACGESVMLGVADVPGCTASCGFEVTSTVQGLDATYELLTPAEYDTWEARRRNVDAGRAAPWGDEVREFADMAHVPAEARERLFSARQAAISSRHLVANFGCDVPIGETRHMYLVVTNRTPMATRVATWLDTFGVDDVSRLTHKGTASTIGAGTVSSLGRATGSRGGSGGGSPFAPKGSKYAPIKLSDMVEKTATFRARQGNDMLATRKMQLEAEGVLGDKGLAVSVKPPDTELEPWSSLVLQVSAFNDMCGDYFDMMHVCVGECEPKHIPVRIGVAGTPLTVQKERVLTKGLRGRTWRTALDFGELPQGVPLERAFYVFNTGGLDMSLSWQFMRMQDESDCGRPEARLVNVQLVVEEEDAAAAGGGVEAAGQAGEEASASSKQGDAPEGGPTAEPAAAPAPAPEAAAAPVPGVEPEAAAEGNEGGDGEQGDQPSEVVEPAMTETLRMEIERVYEPATQPYVVEPAEVVIRGGECAKFVVKFGSGRPADHRGYLIGTQQVDSEPRPISLKLWPEGDDGQSVGALVSSTFHPYAGGPPQPLQPLRIDLSADAIRSRLEPDENTDLELTCTSIHDARHDSYRRVVTMSNLHTCPLLCSMHTEGPFELVGMAPSAPQDPTCYKGTTGAPASFGGQTYVPPRESVDVTLRFKPQWGAGSEADRERGGEGGGGGTARSGTGTSPVRASVAAGRRTRRASLVSNASLEPEPPREDFTREGVLVVSYANGDVQRLPLTGAVLHPALEIKELEKLWPQGVVDFGRVHVQAPKPLTLTLSNLTLVDATWGVVPAGGRAKLSPEDVEEAATGEARFGPFIVSPAGGVLPGRGLGLPRTQKVTVTFAPTEAADCAHALRFAVMHGRSATVGVRGSGSFDETEEHQGNLNCGVSMGSAAAWLPHARAISTSAAPSDLRDFIDWTHRDKSETEAHGRAWNETELRGKSWEDLHVLWHLCTKERNLLLTEMAWRGVPKDTGEMILMSVPRGSDKEEDVHRLRYDEVQKSLKRIKKVLRERAQRELNPVKRSQIMTVIHAK
ncbi:hypothetical protein FOA52_004926 [Chlamydomonas sp. UWO 241]|nr:hypothetical protein FOA52_004926 [Chlamydomonas sp. UWO 241]